MPHTTFAAPLAALLLTVFWKSLLVFALAGLAAFALRRASAAARHAVWLLTLAALLCLPLFCALLPRWAAPVLPAAPHRQVARPALPREQPHVVAPPDAAPPPTASAPTAPALSTPDTPTPPVAALPPIPATPMPTVRPPLPVRQALTLTDGVCLAWLVGVLLVLGRTALGLAAASRLTRRCRLVTAGPLTEAAEDARRALGLRRSLCVRVGPVAVPMTCGVRPPIVLLPEDATDWPADRLRAVLLHEAAHVQRLDWATMLLARCVCALYWPHPLAWLAAHLLRAEAEGACDDLVLTHGGIPAPDYAAHLLEIVRGLSGCRTPQPGTVAMASRPEVAGRLRTILDAHQARKGVSRRRLALAALTALVILAPLAALRPVASARPWSEPRIEVSATTAVDPLADGRLLYDLRLATFMAGQSRWEVRLPDGTRVRLLSVAETDTHGLVISSWTPDGRPQFHADATADAPLAYGNSKFCQFTWGVTFASAQRQNKASLLYEKLGEPAWLRSGGGVGLWQNGQPYLAQYGEWFPVTQTQAALQVSVATGPKEVLIDAPARTGGVRRLTTGEVISVSPPRHRSADVVHEYGRMLDTRSVFVTLPARFVHDGSEYELQTIGWDGKPFTPAHSGGSYPLVFEKTVRLLYTYRTSELANRVKEFRFTYRPSYTAVFRNVALRPTEPSPSASPAPKPAAETKTDDQARFLAGLTAVQGPGVIVTLNDSKKLVPANMHIPGAAPPNLIHDTDINQVVNELKAAGAEAIAVNGERLVAVSAIRSAGPAMFINNVMQSSPYVIRAIGDINTLQAAVNLPRSIADEIRTFDPAMVTVRASAMLTLPAYQGGVPDRYARPIGAVSGTDVLGQSGSARKRAFTIAFHVPQRGVHRVRIIFSDAQGGHLAFNRLCPPGYSIDLPETAHGEKVNFRIFDNERLVKQETF